MKRFTLWTLALLLSVTAFAQKQVAQEGKMLPSLPVEQLMAPGQIKKAPASLQNKFKKRAAARRAGLADDLVGTYLWEYKQADEWSTDLESLETTEGSAYVTVSAVTEDSLVISGMSPNDLGAKIEEDEDGEYILIPGGQLGGTSSYGDYLIYGLFYYEGDEKYEAGWYYDDIYGNIERGGKISLYPWIIRVLTGGEYDGYSLTPYYVEGSTLTPGEAPKVVEIPEGLVAEEYSFSATDNKDQAFTGSVKIGIDGTDVYIQGLSGLLPDAWVKGTLTNNIVTIAGDQYLGNYNGLADFWFQKEDATLAYDAENATFTANAPFYTYYIYSGKGTYDRLYKTLVMKKVVEKAATPANPEITKLENTQWGWRVVFNVPNVDVEGNGLISSKLSYQFYTDIAGTVAPLTFTPATHTALKENLTIIPYGFTDDNDIYENRIYLNDLVSADWNKLGIKSIYTGGGVTNETEIQWFEIDWASLGINEVKVTKVNGGAVYNLSGQRVNKDYKGMVIMNGRKFMNK